MCVPGIDAIEKTDCTYKITRFLWYVYVSCFCIIVWVMELLLWEF